MLFNESHSLQSQGDGLTHADALAARKLPNSVPLPNLNRFQPARYTSEQGIACRASTGLKSFHGILFSDPEIPTNLNFFHDLNLGRVVVSLAAGGWDTILPLSLIQPSKRYRFLFLALSRRIRRIHGLQPVHDREAVERMGERFARMWEFYLALCEAGFRCWESVVFQLQFAKQHGVVPITRDYLLGERRAAEPRL